MIRLKPELFATLDGSLEGLQLALQKAIELEHSTIPPYLYAQYSLKRNSNLEIAGIIRSVVLEEMLHMSIDCNVLNAIGGAPKIDDPGFLPTYPGHLPGGVESGLVVPLAPFSKQLVSDVFMVIEAPDAQTVTAGTPCGAEPEGLTIGDFYKKIIQQITEMGDGIFIKDRSRQLTTGFPALQTMDIRDVKSATDALNLIIEQGEGEAKSPLDPEGEFAHYYRFAEIYFGRALVKNPDTSPGALPYAYVGARIHFDPSGVWPVVANPKRCYYPEGSRAAQLNDSFNATYTSLLRSLHRVFNGQQDWLGPAINSMESMKELAWTMMSTEIVPGQTAGPTFEYLPAEAKA